MKRTGTMGQKAVFLAGTGLGGLIELLISLGRVEKIMRRCRIE